MAFQKTIWFLLAFFITFIPSSHAYTFQVGGKDGWTLHPSESYNSWSSRLRFLINDTLHFKYDDGSDSVLVVNKSDYDECNANNPITKLDGGDSLFKFDRSGPFYFITGNKSNCDQGQKLTVVVLARRNRSPLPSVATPPSSTTSPPSPVVSPVVPPSISPVSPPSTVVSPVSPPSVVVSPPSAAVSPVSPPSTVGSPVLPPSTTGSPVSPPSTAGSPSSPPSTPVSPVSPPSTPESPGSPPSTVGSPESSPSGAPALTPPASSPGGETADSPVGGSAGTPSGGRASSPRGGAGQSPSGESPSGYQNSPAGPSAAAPPLSGTIIASFVTLMIGLWGIN